MATTTVPESAANTERAPSRHCNHGLPEVLGVSRAATNLRCRCGPLVEQDGSMWAFGTAFK